MNALKTGLYVATAWLLGSLNLFSQTSAYKITNLPVQFSYLTDEFTIQDQGGGTYAAQARGGEEYYISLFKATSRFNADSLRYMFVDLYKQDPSVENIQVNETGGGKLGELDGERVRITFMAGGGFYTATAILVRFHINRKYNTFLLTYEMAEETPNNKTRFQAVKKGFEDMCASFAYTDFKYKKYIYAADSITMEYPEFWFAGAGDSCMLIDDGRCKVTARSYVAKDSTTTETYAKCERDKMKKSSALFPAFKASLSTEKWRNDELATKFTGTYEYEEYGARKSRYFLKYFIRRNVGGVIKDFHIQFECPDMYKDTYYSGKFEVMFKSLILPGVAVEVKK
jgi:hypothetical protein